MIMEAKILDSIKTDLLAKQQNLEERLAKIEKNKTRAAGPLDANSTEQAVELQSKGVIDALDNLEHKELDSIKVAINLIDQGTYGTCIGCSEKISIARLQALPYAKECINCIEGE
jgi:RNA polymerase-binding transcription factor DksA